MALLIYCLVAAVVPMWLLLAAPRPSGRLFPLLRAGGRCPGLILGGKTIEYPAFRGWTVLDDKGEAMSLLPILFITIACGACSGFHSMIASGTTSKQLRLETDARPIGYGAMLLEAMVAIVSLCCVMMFAEGAKELEGEKPT